MKKKNKFNFTIMYIGQNEKLTLKRIEPQIPWSEEFALTIIPWVVLVNGNNIGTDCSPCVKSLMNMEFLL